MHDYAAQLIRFKAGKLTRSPGFNRSDLEDIEQNLRLDLLKRLPKYNASKAKPTTFASLVVKREIITIVRHRFAEKRTPLREEYSLDEEVIDRDGRLVARHQTTPEAACDWQDRVDLKHDLAELRERLPSDDHRLILDALFHGGTKNSIVKKHRLPPGKVDLCLSDIYRIFEDGDLREYL